MMNQKLSIRFGEADQFDVVNWIFPMISPQQSA